MTAFDNWLTHEERIQKKARSLRARRSEIKQEIDRLRAINPYYPIGKICGELGNISKLLKRIDNGEDIL